MAVVKADLAVCQGYANCIVAADDVFDLDDDGVVVLLRAEFPGSDRPRMQEAVRVCPVSALSIGES